MTDANSRTLKSGLALWLVYGLLRQDLPLSVANAVMVVLTGAIGAITAMKLRFEQTPGRV